jgi:hypothetical protein
MACIQPFSVRLPHHTNHNGQVSPLTREVFGVLGMFHETKTAQPGVSHFLTFIHIISLILTFLWLLENGAKIQLRFATPQSAEVSCRRSRYSPPLHV